MTHSKMTLDFELWYAVSQRVRPCVKMSDVIMLTVAAPFLQKSHSPPKSLSLIEKPYLITLFDEVDLASEVPAEPDDGPDGRVHALGVASRREHGDGLALVGVGLDDPLGGRVWSMHLVEDLTVDQDGVLFCFSTKK